MNAGYLKHIDSNSIRTLGVATVATALILLSMPAAATTVVPSGPQPFTQNGTGTQSGLQATTSFWVSGSSQQMVNRAKTSSNHVIAPRHILQAAYQDMVSSVSLSLVSAQTDRNCLFTSRSGSCLAGKTAKYASNGSTTSTPSGKQGVGSAGVGILADTDTGVSPIFRSRNRTGPLRVSQKMTTVSGRTLRPASATARASARTLTKKLRLRGGDDLGILSAGDNLSTYNGGFINNSTNANSPVTIASSMPLKDTSYKPSQVGDLDIKNIAYNDVTSATSLSLVPPTAIPEPSGLALFPLAVGLMLWSMWIKGSPISRPHVKRDTPQRRCL